MNRTRWIVLGSLVVLIGALPYASEEGISAAAPEPASKTPLKALQEFHDLIGSWRATGMPYGTREEKERGFWQEKISWRWMFKGSDVWLRAPIEKGKYYNAFELRYLPATDGYELKAFKGKEALVFTGKLESKRLTVERTDPKTKQAERLVFSLLHYNRHLYRYEVKPPDRATFVQVYQVGATKEGVDFASVDRGIECIVSGGLGTMPVTHKGKTYYVCCSGCRDAFREEPEKYIKEFEEKEKKKKKASE